MCVYSVHHLRRESFQIFDVFKPKCNVILSLNFRDVSPGEVDSSGLTELHIACDVGRPHNVEVLLQHAFKGTVK